MRKHYFVAATLVSLTTLLGGITPSNALAATTSVDKPPSITVVGTGRVKAKPDEAALSMGVVTQGTTASEALAANNKAMAGLMDTLRANAIQERDVQTSNFSIYPEYRSEPVRDYANRTESTSISRPTIVGYRVSNEVHVRIRHAAELGKLLDAVVKSGANNVNGISFTFSEPETLLSEARAKAIADARRKAEQYATAAGVKVGKILYIDEQNAASPPYPVPNVGFMAMGKGGGESVSVSSGEQEVGVTVSAVYAIE